MNLVTNLKRQPPYAKHLWQAKESIEHSDAISVKVPSVQTFLALPSNLQCSKAAEDQPELIKTSKGPAYAGTEPQLYVGGWGRPVAGTHN